jgi:hypothetical protein
MKAIRRAMTNHMRSRMGRAKLNTNICPVLTGSCGGAERLMYLKKTGSPYTEPKKNARNETARTRIISISTFAGGGPRHTKLLQSFHPPAACRSRPCR